MQFRMIALGAVCAAALPLLPAHAAEAATVSGKTVAWAYVTKAAPKQIAMNKKGPAPVGKYTPKKTVYRSYFQLQFKRAAGRTVSKAVLRFPIVAPNPCREAGVREARVWRTAQLKAKTSWKTQPKGVKASSWTETNCTGKRIDFDITRLLAKVKAGKVTFGVQGREKTEAAFLKLGVKPVILITYKKKASPPPTEEPGTGLDPRYPTCTAAKKAGYGPYVRGRDPEYYWYEDRDKDGKVCE